MHRLFGVARHLNDNVIRARWLVLLMILLNQADEVGAEEIIVCEPEPTDMLIAYGDTVDCLIDQIGDTDQFRFVGTIGDTIVVQMTTAEFDRESRVELYRPNGTLVDFATGEVDSRIDVELDASGTFAIRAKERDDDETAAYALSLERIAPSPSSTPICFGCSITDLVDIAGDIDLYSFVGTSGETIVAQMTTAEFNRESRIELFRPDGSRVDFAEGEVDSRIDATLDSSGEFVLLLKERDDDETAEYTVDLERIAPSPSSMPICLGCSAEDSIEPAGDIDLYSFVGSFGETIVAQMTTAEFDRESRIELFRPDGSLVDFAEGEVDSRIDATLDSSGDFVLLLKERDDDEAALYTVSLERVAPPSPSAIFLCFGCLINEQFDPVGDLDLYWFLGTTGDAITAQVATGVPAQSHVELFNPDGLSIEAATGENSATINRVLDDDGIYSILAKERDDDQTSPYSVSLQCIGTCLEPVVFIDGFETGDTSAWSSQFPPP